MKIALLFILVLSVYAGETCYTVQLISKYNSSKNLELLSQEVYPKSCKVMQIGKSVTVRCGCFEKFDKATESLNELSKEYRQAALATTYKYRFAETEVQTPVVVDKPLDAVKEEKEVKADKVILAVVTKPLDAVQEKEPKVVEALKIEEPVLVAEEETVAVATPVVVPEKKLKKKKSKKKKKKKTKYIKKRDAQYVYDPYLKMLKNDEGIGPFDYRYEFGGQVSYDLGLFSEVDAVERSEYVVMNDWRRVRVSHKGSFLDETLFYELEYSFTGNSKYKDIFLGYTNTINALNLDYRFKAGNIKIPFSLETYTSSKYITFMERALTDAFAEGRKMGGELLLSSKINRNRMNLFVAGFSNSIDQRRDDEIEQPGYSLRGTYAYKYDKRHIISVGGGYMNQDMKGEDVRFNQASESEFTPNYVSVRIKDVDTLSKTNIEALYINEKFSLQGEYTTASTASIEEDYSFNAYYLEGSYFLLGKGKRYKLSTSTLRKIKPNKDGAVELAFRYSYIDLNDKDEVGGTQKDYNYGLNWYYSPELKFMLNYIVAEPKGTDDYSGQLKVLQTRVLFAF